MKQILDSNEMSTLIRCGTVTFIMFFGDPNLMSAIIKLLESFR